MAENKVRAPKPKVILEDEEPRTEAPVAEAPAVESEAPEAALAEAAEQTASEELSEAGEAQAAPAPKPTVAERLASARARSVSALDQVAPGHPYTLLFGMLGLVCALLVFAIGFVNTLFIVCMIVLGVAIGQLVDGDPKIIRAIQRLFVRDE